MESINSPTSHSNLKRDVELICTVSIGVDPIYIYDISIIELGNIKERVEELSAEVLEKKIIFIF